MSGPLPPPTDEQLTQLWLQWLKYVNLEDSDLDPLHDAIAAIMPPRCSFAAWTRFRSLYPAEATALEAIQDRDPETT